MTGCAESGSECWYSRSDNPRRKYSGTLEVVVSDGARVGINTARANRLIGEAVVEQRLEGFEAAELVRSEVAIPDESGRFDLLLQQAGQDCFVEIKNVTLHAGDGLGLFPDAASPRALKHVRALTRLVTGGARAALVFCVQHTGINRVSTADHIDPAYASAVRDARDAGVMVLAYGCSIEPDRIAVKSRLPVDLPG